jgi:hypothetical protein
MLDAPPQAGEGVHYWLFRVARQLHEHLPAGEIVRLLKDKTAMCGRHVSEREIVTAVQNALPVAWRPGTKPIATVSKWPEVNQQARNEIIRDGSLADLWELSPVRIESNEPKTEEIIDRLFPGNPLHCCGSSSQSFATRPRDDWRGQLAGMALVVPSPMTAKTGQTKDGRESEHSLANTGNRRFLVVEFDTGTGDEHAALLIHLAGFAPLVCAVHSAGKSLHGWFYVGRSAGNKIEKFFRYAVSLGADRATWTRSQFVRMPDGTRDTGQRQTVYFLNFKPLEAA